MRYIIEDKKYRFKSAFDTVTGAYGRPAVAVGDDFEKFLEKQKTACVQSRNVVKY